MKRVSLAFLIGIFFLLLSNTALANSVSLTIEYVHQDHYYFSVNGSSNFSTMMCDSFDNHIYLGETWTATKSPFLAGIANGLFGSSMALDYKAAGLIYKSMLSGTLTTLQAQWAIWGLFSSNARHDHDFLTYGGASTDAFYLLYSQIAPNSAYSGLVLYTPLHGKPGCGPQEFIGYSQTPEPSTLMLLGTGLIGLAGTVRRKFARA